MILVGTDGSRDDVYEGESHVRRQVLVDHERFVFGGKGRVPPPEEDVAHATPDGHRRNRVLEPQSNYDLNLERIRRSELF